MHDLVKLRARDPVYLQQIFDEINPFLFRFLYQNKVFSEAAQEIVQETWAIFFANIDRYSGDAQIRTYIAGIALNKVREHRRQTQRTIPEEDAEAIYEKSFTRDGWWIRGPTDPHRILQAKEIGRLVEECMEGLPENQREAFILRELNQESSDEICKIMGVSITNLGVLIFRAKDKLKQCMEGKL